MRQCIIWMIAISSIIALACICIFCFGASVYTLARLVNKPLIEAKIGEVMVPLMVILFITRWFK